MRDGFVENFYSICFKKRKENDAQTPSNIEKYDVYFKRYAQICVKETVRLYTSMKEFGLAKGV
jgi:hypothetical protein